MFNSRWYILLPGKLKGKNRKTDKLNKSVNMAGSKNKNTSSQDTKNSHLQNEDWQRKKKKTCKNVKTAV